MNDERRSPNESDRQSLERDVRLLTAGLGIEGAQPGGVVFDEVVALARQGKRTEAVRALKRAYGLGLVAAKRIVDAAAHES